MKRLVNLILGMVLLTGTLGAQEMFVSSGSEGKSTKASLTWVVGGGIVAGQNDASPFLTPEVLKNNNIALKLKDNLNTDVQISVYPNPVTEFVNVNMMNSELIGGDVIITDISGKEVLTERMEKTKMSLPVTSLSKGVYTVCMTDRFGKQTGSVKIVKN